MTVPEADPAARAVTVRGSGIVSAVPDLVRITVTVTATRPAVADAFEAVARAGTAVTDTLREYGVSGPDLATTGLSVHSETTWAEGRGSEVTGYTAATTLQITVREAGADAPPPAQVVAACVGAGGDDIRLGGLEFDFSDPAALAATARERAWADALDRAEQYASLSGRALGEVLDIAEVEVGDVSPRPVAKAFAAADSPVAVERGEKPTRVDVRVRWRLV
ncbi:SIMPL domain-containing protein [Rhodococcus sp. NPDC057014]|uniref:SIMPL domain-containing protein n=1 Tax=unclassified Rhodococcus (in: high G+C Gram-positive bacteria) TaxID=192944 RepID=UPI0036373B14